MHGTISGVENHGSIVILRLTIDGTDHPICFDRRAFFTMAEAEQAESPDDLIGRPAFFTGESIEFHGQPGGRMTAVKFDPGHIVATPGALRALREAGQQPDEFLSRHLAGDWGDLDDEDKRLNAEAVVDGSRILSSYRTRLDERIWLITEATSDDGRRGSSTLLLPDEY